MFQRDADVQRRGPSFLRSMNAERWEEKGSPTRETARRMKLLASKGRNDRQH